MKAIWINDIHLECLYDIGREGFLDALRRHHADCVLVGGDIAQAPMDNRVSRGVAMGLECEQMHAGERQEER